MSSTTTIYGIHYPVLGDAADISGVGTTASDIDTLIDKIDSGEAFKKRVSAVATTNINLSSLPATIDGVTLANGDLFLCTGQSTAAQNGVQKYSTAGGAATRPSNFTTGTAGPGAVRAGHVVAGGVAGTSNGGIWQNTNTGAITVDTTGLTYRKTSGVNAIAGTDLATEISQQPKHIGVVGAAIAGGTVVGQYLYGGASVLNSAPNLYNQLQRPIIPFAPADYAQTGLKLYGRLVTYFVRNAVALGASVTVTPDLVVWYPGGRSSNLGSAGTTITEQNGSLQGLTTGVTNPGDNSVLVGAWTDLGAAGLNWAGSAAVVGLEWLYTIAGATTAATSALEMTTVFEVKNAV